MAEKLISKINRVEVTEDELCEIALAVDDLPAERRDFYGFMAIVAQRFSDDNELKSLAVVYRMQALSRFLKDRDVKGWTKESDEEGAVLTHRALFGAAAATPLSETSEWPAFESESLLLKALEVADEEGTA